MQEYTEANKKSKKFLKFLGFAVLFLILLVFGAAYGLVEYALGKGERQTKEEIISDFSDIVDPSWLNNITIEEHKSPVLGDMAYKVIRGDSTKSKGNVAVLVHGYKCEALYMLKLAYIYQGSMNYDVYMPDLHAHGDTPGDYIQMGWLDRLDVEKLIDQITDSYLAKGIQPSIVVHGISMGAATAMMMSGDSLPSSVKCFVEDCGYTSVYDEFRGELKNRFSLPEYPLLPIASMICKAKNGWNFKEASSLEQVKKCNKPMLFIHGDKDKFVPTEMVYRLYDAKPGNKEMWVSKDAAHDQTFSLYPAGYKDKIKSFCDKYMN